MALTVVHGTTVVNLLANRQFLVEWLPNTETSVDHYNIYRSTSQFTGFSVQGQIASSSQTLQFIDTVPFTFGVNFFWKVTAIDTTGLTESSLDDTEAVTDTTLGRFDEEPFKQVTVQLQDFVFNEVPQGTKNGINTAFTTAVRFRKGSLQFYLNGVLQQPGINYTENTVLNGFTVITPVPISTDFLSVSYIRFA